MAALQAQGHGLEFTTPCTTSSLSLRQFTSSPRIWHTVVQEVPFLLLLDLNRPL